MPEVNGPKLIELLWEKAMTEVEGPDSMGEPINPGDVWTSFKATVAALGLELEVRPRAEPITTWPTHIEGIPVEDLVRLASGLSGRS
jgi:hypothetical protein